MIFCSIKRSDFKKNYSKNRFKTSMFLLFAVENGLQHSRYGIVVTKKNGNAIKRNKIKRWIKNSLYQNIKDLNTVSYDYIVIANRFFDFNRADFNQLDKGINEIICKISK